MTRIIGKKRLQDHLARIHEEKRYRVFRSLASHPESFPRAIYHRDSPTPNTRCEVEAESTKSAAKETIIWCSNDYLGLGHHPKVIANLKQTLDNTGGGSGGTRNISGTHPAHVKLEQCLAAFHKKEAALLFGSGYMANLAGLSALIAGLEPVCVYSDAQNHNSIVNAIRLARASLKKGPIKKQIFRHNDTAHLRTLLETDMQEGKLNPRADRITQLIVCESVYSMSGELAPLAEIVEIARSFDAFLYLDEVHAVGLYGPHGGGLTEQTGLNSEVDFIQGTLGKSLGLMGGYITGESTAMDLVRSIGDGFIFTTSLPPHLCQGGLTALELLQGEIGQKARRTLKKRMQQLLHGIQKLKLSYQPNLPAESHILSLIVGDAQSCNEISERLLDKYGCYLPAINYPTVPRGSERIRITVGPKHTPEMIKQLLLGLADCTSLWPKLGLKHTPELS